MAQTSVAREPSMEEILASIRRIIEDSDVTRQSVPDAPTFPARSAVAEFRRPVPVVDDSAEKAEKPAMMRDILQPEPVAADPLSEEEREEDEEISLDAQNDDRRLIADTDAETAFDGPIEDVERTASESDDGGAVEELSAEPEQPVSDLEPEEPVAAVSAPPEDKPAAVPHILSETTERQVATAFQDLDHAVRSEPRRSFDEIAAEILRPMLQDWLDHNLPPLVERLVREEIERVVRSGR